MYLVIITIVTIYSNYTKWWNLVTPLETSKVITINIIIYKIWNTQFITSSILT